MFPDSLSQCHENNRAILSASLAMETQIAPVQNKRKLEVIWHKSSLFREEQRSLNAGDAAAVITDHPLQDYANRVNCDIL